MQQAQELSGLLLQKAAEREGREGVREKIPGQKRAVDHQLDPGGPCNSSRFVFVFPLFLHSFSKKSGLNLRFFPLLKGFVKKVRDFPTENINLSVKY